MRQLGIPTVKDRVAQIVEQARRNCWNYAWVIDMDIKGFFDNIDHGLMIKSLRHYTGQKHVITYVKRWLKAPIQLNDGSQIQNTEKGTPQGGVISPLLANLFLHVVFDKWIEKEFSDCPFERYADDIIVHVKNETTARYALKQIRLRFEECKLELHPDKTKIVYCDRKGRKKKKEVHVRFCERFRSEIPLYLLDFHNEYS